MDQGQHTARRVTGAPNSYLLYIYTRDFDKDYGIDYRVYQLPLRFTTVWRVLACFRRTIVSF